MTNRESKQPSISEPTHRMPALHRIAGGRLRTALRTLWQSLRQRRQRGRGTRLRRDPSVEHLERRLVLATVTWRGAGDGQSWADANNWDRDGAMLVPQNNDEVVIPDLPGNITVEFDSGLVLLNKLTSAESLSISGGYFSVGGRSQIDGTLTLTGGELEVRGLDLTVADTFDWLGGTIRGDGKTLIDPGAVMNIRGTGPHVYHTHDIRGSGTIHWTEGTLAAFNNATLHLQIAVNITGAATKTLDGGTVSSTSTITWDGAGDLDLRDDVTVEMGGTLIVQDDATINRVSGNPTFNKEGSVEVQNGTLTIASLVRSTWKASTRISGPGFVQFNYLAAVIGAGVVAENLRLGPGGQLDVQQDLTITDQLHWTGGTLSGNGTTVLDADAVINIDGGETKTLNSHTIAGDGVVQWTDGMLVSNASTISADLHVAGSAVKTLSSTLDVTGTTMWTGGEFRLLNATTLNNHGRFVADSNARMRRTGTSGTPVFHNAGTFEHIAAGVTTFGDRVFFNNVGDVRLLDGTLDIERTTPIQFDDPNFLSMLTSGTLVLHDDFVGMTQNNQQFSAQGRLLFDGGTTTGSPQLLEVMSEDRGAVPNGFANNFAIGLIELDATAVQLVDSSDNSVGGPEAAYADALIVGAGSTLDLNGLNLYVRAAHVEGSVINGTIQVLSDGGSIVLETPTSGTISASGQSDEWTVSAEAGDLLDVTADPGGDGSAPPIPMVLGKVSIQVVAPDDTVVATGESSAAGEFVTLSDITLPQNGAYRIRIAAASTDSTATGNYTLTVGLRIGSDFGDAPAPYPTLLSEGGAEHIGTGLTLGSQRDKEADGSHSLLADADDSTGTPDDEDGVTFGTIQVGALDATVTVDVQGGSGKLDAWVDFNGDGNWGGPGEQVFASHSVNAGANVLTFDVPATANAGTTYARFRLSTAGGPGVGGSAADGEVEDYQVTVIGPAASAAVFMPRSTISTTADGATDVLTADVDGDGDLDVLSAFTVADTITWYENDGAQGYTRRTISTAATNVWRVWAADVDGDGDMDALSSSFGGGAIAWHENDGNQNFTQRTIDSSSRTVTDVQAADVDGDGDLDVLIASSTDSTILWHENDGSQNFSERTIGTSAFGVESVQTADVDGDGDLDVLSASQQDDTIAWHENDGSQNFTEHTISVTADGAMSVRTADMDGDGDLDVIGASRHDNTIAWYENDGSQNFATHTVSTSADNVLDIQVADVDGDGDLDVVSVSSFDNMTSWHRNDGSQNFTRHLIDKTMLGLVSSVHVADVDGDGDLDVLNTASVVDTVAWFENVTPDFGDAPAPYPTLLADDGAFHKPVGPTLGASRDIEHDGQPTVSADGDGADDDGVTFGTIQVGALDAKVTVDVQGASGKLDAWIDFNGDGNWGGPGEQIFASHSVVSGANILTFDVPATAAAGTTYARFRLSTAGKLGIGGGAFDGEVEDYQVTVVGPAASSAAFLTHTISTTANGAHDVQVADLDGDGDLDAVAAHYDNARIVWYENDGTQNFTEHMVSSSVESGAWRVDVADVDGDGDMDVLGTVFDADRIAWYENDGSQNFTRHIIDNLAGRPRSVQAGDLDGDGDTDVLAAFSENEIAWYRNDGSEGFSKLSVTATAGSVASVRAADVDGDGDLDVLGALLSNDTIAWYENDGNHNFISRTITTTAEGAHSVRAADVDGDGDMDVLAASLTDDTIAWYENDSIQNFTEHIVSTTADSVRMVEAADVDGDGDVDILSASGQNDTIAWYRNDGQQNFTRQVISSVADHAASVRVGDVDGDGDLDVLSASRGDDRVVWYENVTPDFGDAPAPYPTLLADDGAFHKPVGPSLGATRDVEFDGQPTTSADGDGADDDGVTFGTIQVGALDATVTVDVQGGSGKLDAWIDFNGDGNWGGPGEQIFASHSVVSGANILAFDVPATGSAGTTYARFRLSTAGGLGIVGGATDGEVEDYQITVIGPSPAAATFVTNTISSGVGDSAFDVELIDFDGDGDMDVLTASPNDLTLLWYENDGTQHFARHSISTAFPYYEIEAVDVDGDGNLDVVASMRLGGIDWYRNDGSQSFGDRRTISTTFTSSSDLQVADVDGDGNPDILSTSYDDDIIAWFRNDGNQNFQPITITTTADGAEGVEVADVDGDGDLDVLSASERDNTIAWYENDGSENFTKQTITTAAAGAYDVRLADLDSDGDMDVLSASTNDNTIAWYENDGGQVFARQTISTDAASARMVQAADVDGDGDMDVLSASFGDDTIALYRNDGSQTFSRQTISTTADGAWSVQVGDVDRDGDLDVIGGAFGGDTLEWYENATPDFGDAAAPFPTLLADDGAFHIPTGPMLGDTRDVEFDGQPSTAADGDGADDDGVTFGLVNPELSTAEVTIDLRGTATAKVDAWLDFGGDGSWDAGDQILDNVTVNTGPQTFAFTIPSFVKEGFTYARVRVSTAGDLEPTGRAEDGEVEDYLVPITPNITIDLPTGVSNDVTLRRNNTDVDVLDNNGGTLIATVPLATTQSLIVNGGNLNDNVTVDFAGGIFGFPEGVSIEGGSGTDHLFVTGTGNTRATYHSSAGALGNARLTVRDGLESSEISFTKIEPLDVTGMQTFDVEDTLNVGADTLTIDSTLMANLGSLTTMSGGSIVSAAGVALGSGENLVGRGAIAGAFAGQSGSTVSLTGNLSIGDAMAVHGFDTGGILQVNNYTATLLDANQAVLGSLTTLGSGGNPGTASAANGVLIDFGNNVTGIGTLNTPDDMAKLAMINGAVTGNSSSDTITLAGYVKGVGSLDNVTTTGTYSPGFSPAEIINGSMAYGDSGTLILELGGTTPGSSGHDQIRHTGTAVLDGEFRVDLIDGFTPADNNSFVLMTASDGITGDFDSVTLPPAPAGKEWNLAVESNEVRLEVASIPAVTGPTGEITDTQPTITWQPIAGAASYELWLELLGGSNNPVANVTFTDTSYAVTKHLGIGRYRSWVRANLAAGGTTDWTSADFQISLPPELQALPFHADDLTPAISWNPVAGATSYRVYIGNATVGGPALVNMVISGTSYTPATDLEFGRHRIWVRGIGAGGYEAAWSDVQQYYIGPDLLTPTVSTFEQQPLFTWSSVPGIASYQLYVQRGSTVVINQSGITGTSHSPSTPLDPGAYRWWIRPFHANGNAGAWSELGEFYIGGRPQIVAPTGTSSSTPQIDWNEVQGAGSYEVYLFNDDGLGLIHRQSGLTVSSFDSFPLPDGNYVVWVKSYKANGDSGLWSRPASFSVNDATVATTATPQNPLTPVLDTTPEFNWTADAAVDSVDLYLRNDDTFLSEIGLSGASWTPADSLSPGEWNWWVRTRHADGSTGPWSSRVTTDVSGRPVLLGPVGSTNNIRPTISWTPVGLATRYILQVDNLTTGQSSVIREDQLTATEFTPAFDLDSGHYRAWVRAINGANNDHSPWSFKLDFSVAQIDDVEEDSEPLLTVLTQLFARSNDTEAFPSSTRSGPDAHHQAVDCDERALHTARAIEQPESKRSRPPGEIYESNAESALKDIDSIMAEIGNHPSTVAVPHTTQG